MASPAKESNDCDALLGEESITFDLDDENCHDETMNADLHASDNDEDPSKVTYKWIVMFFRVATIRRNKSQLFCCILTVDMFFTVSQFESVILVPKFCVSFLFGYCYYTCICL